MKHFGQVLDKDVKLIFCFLSILIPGDDSTAEIAKEKNGVMLLFVFGGMDTQGEIFNDCLVLRPEIVNKN